MTWLETLIATSPKAPHGLCSHCDEPIPRRRADRGDESLSPAKYCSVKCKRRAKLIRHVRRLDAARDDA